MFKTYMAKLKQNKLKWIDDKPDSGAKDESVLVYVTIINEKKNNKALQKDNIVDFFKNSPLYDADLEIDSRNDYGREVEL